MLLSAWQSSRYYRGLLSDWVDINPPTPLPSFASDSAVSFVPMEAVGEKDGSVEVQTTLYDNVATGYTRFAEGDVIWAKITPCMQNGKSAVPHDLIEKVGFGSTEFHVLRPKTEQVLSEFLLSALQSDPFLTYVQATFSGSAGQLRIPDTVLKNLPLPLPPLSIQRELVDAIQAARDRRAAQLEAADAELAGIDAFLVEQLGLTPPLTNDRPIFAMRLSELQKTGRLNADYFHPERIEAIRTAQTHHKQGLRSAPLHGVVNFVRDQVPADADPNYLGLANVQSNTGELVLSESEVGGICFAFQRDDILFGRLRPYLNKVYKADQSGICSTEFHVMRLREEREIGYTLLPEYLAAVLRSSLVLAQTRHMMTGNTHPRLANEDVINLIVPIPLELKIQVAIAQEVQRRREAARKLRDDAAREWEQAKAEFERRLLGTEATVPSV